MEVLPGVLVVARSMAEVAAARKRVPERRVHADAIWPPTIKRLHHKCIAAGIPRKRAVSMRPPGTCPNSRRRVHWGAMLGDSIAVLTEGRSSAVVLAISYRTLSAAPGG